MPDVTRFRIRSQNLSWRQVGDEVVVLDLEDTVYLTLNSTGTVLWEALADGATRDELVSRLGETYPIGADQAAVDVDAFLDRCRQEKLIEPTDH